MIKVERIGEEPISSDIAPEYDFEVSVKSGEELILDFLAVCSVLRRDVLEKIEDEEKREGTKRLLRAGFLKAFYED